MLELAEIKQQILTLVAEAENQRRRPHELHESLLRSSGASRSAIQQAPNDLVREGNGWQIPPDDFESLVTTMKDALSDVARLRRMGKESYRVIKEEINIEKMVEVFVTALNSFE